MNKILLIGSEGYIGSYLKLMLKDYPVDYMDNYLFYKTTRKEDDYRTLTEGELKNWDTIILLAGHSSVKSCENNMAPVYRNNVQNFVELLNKLGNQRLIYASSGSVLSGTKPSNWYDLSKLQIDQVAAMSNKNTYGLRFGTVNGWSPVLRTDLMINSMYSSALENGFISCYGSDNKRPLLGIKDLAGAVRAIIKSKEDCPGIYNVASFNTVVKDVAEAVAAHMNVPIQYPDDQSTPYSFEADTSEFSSTFNFTFTETTQSILEGLQQGYTTSVKVKRDKAIIYE